MSEDDGLKTESEGSKTGSSEGTSSDEGNNTDSSKVIFTAEQQTRVQQLIDSAHNRALLKAGESGNQALEEANARIAELENSTTKKSTAQGDEIKKLLADSKAAHNAEMQPILEKLSLMGDESKRNKIMSAASKHNVVDIGDVTQLVWNNVEVVDDKIVIKGDNGVARMDINTGLEMTIDAYLSEWLGARPHHLRASGAPGGGSVGARGGEAEKGLDFTSLEAVQNMPIGDLKKGISGDGIKLTGVQGQEFTFKDVTNPLLEARKRKFAK